MKVEITEKGVYDKDGNPIEIGTEIEVKGGSVPAWLINKAKAIKVKAAKDEGDTAVTNPAKGAVQQKKAD